MKVLLCMFITVACVGYMKADRSSEGTKFAAALSPSGFVIYDGELILNARQTTSVTISTATGSEVVTVHENWSLHYGLDYDMRTTNGIEEKGLIITSDEPITVQIAADSSTTVGNACPDTVLLRPASATSLEYFLAGFDDDYAGLYYPKSFYMVIASEDDTEVNVYSDLGVEHFTLQRFEVFTRDAHYMEPRTVDFTGTRIVATKPVSVFSGDGYATLYAEGGSTIHQYMQESMPSVEELGTEYTTFPLHFGGDGGYEVRIIAVHDDTDVTIPAFTTSFVLNMGEFHVVDNLETRLGFRISCSKPCMAVQYMKSLPSSGTPDGHMGMFMAVLIPDEMSSNSLIFTLPSIMIDSEFIKAAVSIVVNSYPVTGLFLNDTSLTYLDWEPVEGSSNWYATVEIGTGFYQLYSTEPSERFTAYLHLIQSYYEYLAMGSPIGFTGMNSNQIDPVLK